MSIELAAISLAMFCVAVKPEEQKRFTLNADVVFG